MQDAKLFRSWCRWLQRHFPIHTKHRVVLGMPPDEPASKEGLCDLSRFPESISMFVRETLSTSHTASVLIHEWTHGIHADRVPEFGDVCDEGPLHAVLEREIGNKWDKLRGVKDGES